MSGGERPGAERSGAERSGGAERGGRGHGWAADSGGRDVDGPGRLPGWLSGAGSTTPAGGARRASITRASTAGREALGGSPSLRGPASLPGLSPGPGRPQQLSPSLEGRLARRDLALASVVVVGLSRLLDGPLVWLVAALVLGAVAVGALQVLAEDDPTAETTGVPIESVILPAVAAVASVGAIRLVPIGLWLAPALLLTGLAVDRALALESRILRARSAPGPEERTRILVATLVIGFVGFAGAAAIVPGGLAEPAGEAGGALEESNLLVLAAADAAIAFLLGYRAAALRVTNLMDALWSAATYAGAIAIGAAAVRAMEIPRLVGPALLILAFYLWDAFHGAPRSRRRDVRWIWQTALLAILGIAVVLWNLQLRG